MLTLLSAVSLGPHVCLAWVLGGPLVGGIPILAVPSEAFYPCRYMGVSYWNDINGHSRPSVCIPASIPNNIGLLEVQPLNPVRMVTFVALTSESKAMTSMDTRVLCVCIPASSQGDNRRLGLEDELLILLLEHALFI